MTFFDKFFTIRNRNKGDNGFKFAIESLRSSVFEIAKSQIRVVLFRECERRGRKLLFDSNAVEKLPLGSHLKTKDFLCKSQNEQVQYGRFLDFVEVTDSHGYKYKKPSSDVTLLGEMIFGSVAMVFKGVNTCKIHSLTSPKCVMFTNIVHAPNQCHYQLTSHHCFGTSFDLHSGSSINDYISEERTSSSDSKLYMRNESGKCNTSTYPYIKQKVHNKKLCQCGAHNPDPKLTTKSISHASTRADNSEKCSVTINGDCETITCFDSNESCEKISKSVKDSVYKYSELCLNSPQNEISEYKSDFRNTIGSFSDFYEWSKEAFSSVNGVNSSLGSLRRRWMQSRSSSVDEAWCEEIDNSKNKTRTKLGMGLVVDLTCSFGDELEKFLFNHTIIIESILQKLQSSIETAYVRKENFVDLTYAAFINCQQSMYELITGGKYAIPMWLTLTGATFEEQESHDQHKIFSQYHENIKDCRKQDTLNNIKIKFLSDFCDVIVKFDTKDTNFFISTLLTAVLTHHLSWVTGIAESDIALPQHKLQSVIKGLRSYNPIWAQLNDLNGILGSPLKSARTVITGPETSKSCIASIIQVLTYFIRCYNIVENIYDFDFEEVTSLSEDSVGIKGKKSFETIDRSHQHNGLADVEKAEDGSPLKTSWPLLDISSNKQSDYIGTKDTVPKNVSKDTVKKSKSYLFRSEAEEEESVGKSGKLYTNIDDMTRLKNVNTSGIRKKMDEVINTYEEECNKKVQKIIKVRSKVICHLEQNLSPDEGYDTVDSTDVCPKQCMGECATSNQVNDNVLFVLGENDALVNLKKIVTTKSSIVDIEREDPENLVQFKNLNLYRSKSISFPVSVATDCTANGCRTLCKDSVTEIELAKESVIQKHSHSHKEVGERHTVSDICELPMPSVTERCTKRRLDVSSVLGSINDHYNSEQIIQGILAEKEQWANALQKDLALYAHNSVVDRNVTEALCIIGDLNSWEVSLFSSRNFTMDRSRFSGVRIGMSQLVADMLESLLHIYRIKLSPDFCLDHIEKKLHEIYTKSKSVAELLNSTEMCSMEYLTSRLDICVNDVPLLLSVATTHSPHISSKYGLTFT